MNMITLTAADGFALPALHVASATGNGRALVLIQEIFGINAGMKAAAQAWAQDGFDVLCPDLFARQQPSVDLDPTQADQFQQGVALMQGMDDACTLRDLEAARAWFVAQGRGSKVAALGYCLGGRLAVQLALHTPISAAVSYYGVGLENLLPETPVTMAPCLLHIADLDAYVPPEVRQTILDRAALQTRMPVHVYPGCDHGFARPQGQRFDAAAAEQARVRSLDFLRD